MRHLLKKAEAHLDEIIAIRRDIHQHPETGFDVQRTAQIVADNMNALKLKVKTQIGKTGVVADLDIPGATRRIALRADMDALPIQEKGTAEYCSQNEGKAHMCGHDVHTAMLIGAAKMLSQMADDLKVNVRFVFQPCEERFPSGAPAMIKDGVLEGVDEIYGQHVWPINEVGYYGLRVGPLLAQTDAFSLRFVGKGGHAAFPHLAIDPIVMASQFVTLVQSLISRHVDPLDSGVITIGMLKSGDTFNVIPTHAEILGTVRTLNPQTRARLFQGIKDLAQGIALTHGGQSELEIKEGFPVTVNHQTCVEHVLSVLPELTDTHMIQGNIEPVMGGEDFSYYTERIPACFVLLGSGNQAKGINKMVHHPEFDVDENCMVYGMALHAAIALASKAN